MKKIKNLIIITLLLLSSCGDGDINKVKNGKLKEYQDKTIGEAINGKLNDIIWDSYSKSGKTYVRITGMTMSHQNRSKIDLIYLIKDDKSNFEVYDFKIDNKAKTRNEYNSFIKELYE